MIAKFSVKKPLTIIMAVMLVIVLGFVSFSNMKTDLLPSIDMPYVIVVTTYPGANPEKVETAVTKPLESVLSTTGGIDKITSVSRENSSMISMQFTYDVNMDSVMLEINNKIDMLKSKMDSNVSSPMVMKINPDMLPIMAASIDIANKNPVEISKKLQEDVIPSLEKVSGVASITPMGLVEEKLNITLSDEKIEKVNDKILESIDSELVKTKNALSSGEKALNEAKSTLAAKEKEQSEKLDSAENGLDSGKSQIQAGLDKINSSIREAEDKKQELVSQRAVLQAAIEQMIAAGMTPSEEQMKNLELLNASIEKINQTVSGLEGTKKELSSQLDDLSNQQQKITSGKQMLSAETAKAKNEIVQKENELKAGKEKFSKARDEAYKKANLSGVITKDMISNIISAQNFSMPAGYIKENGEQYSVKVGDKFASTDEISNLEIIDTKNEKTGIIKLSDVADISFVNNADENYAKINGNNGILLTIQKQSNASTSDVSKALRAAMDKVEKDNKDINMTVLEDQGMYIDYIIGTVIKNLLMGAVLAILILLLFLKNIKPTVIVALSIPISLMLAVVLMYFTGVNLNVISLSGLALGVGMLVDNSIVVIENIYRMRMKGISAKDAAVDGTKQVAGAITASTLTTICVFLPIVFTEGISRELFTDMGLTIAYSLLASLAIAMTLVPVISAHILKKEIKETHRIFDKFTALYTRTLNFTLKHKAPVLIVTVILLASSIFAAATSGTAFMPKSDTSELLVTLETPAGTKKADTYKTGDKAAEIIKNVEGVDTVGAIEGNTGNSISMYVLLNKDRKNSSMEISNTIAKKTESLDCKIKVSGGMDSMMSFASSGVQVKVSGDDLDKLADIAKDIEKKLEPVEGISSISTGLEQGNTETRITVDKNKAMKYQLTVASVYQQVAEKLKNENESTALTLDSGEFSIVTAADKNSFVTRENLKDLKLTLNEKDENGDAKTIKLSEIASIDEKATFMDISHNEKIRTIIVNAVIDENHNIGLVTRDVEKALEGYKAPDGYKVDVGGENEMINSTLKDLILMLLLAILLIYMIMVAQFQSFVSPFIVMFTLPLAMTGGMLALWICGFEISVIAMLGFLVLSGVVVNNGIVFVDYTNQLREKGYNKRDALITAGQRRIRPILMTALTTILGLLTLSLGIGQGADMVQPMAVVVVGGLLYSTFLTLYIVPVFYDIFRREKKKKASENSEEKAFAG